MIRRVQFCLNETNIGKIKKLDKVMDESLRILNSYIDILWKTKSSNKFSSIKMATWLSARLQQCLIKQAVEVVKSQYKKKKKTKPIIRKSTLNLDQRFLSFTENVNSFDFWIHISSLGNGIILNLPTKKHKHFLKYRYNNWNMRKGGRLRKNDNGWFLDIYMEKQQPKQKIIGSAIGVDIGYKKLIACSDEKIYDTRLEKMYEKISHKRQGSKAFKRALTERNQKINQTINSIDLNNIKTVVVENLKSVKYKTHGKIRKAFNNKLQRWSYPKVLGKLQSVCEVKGIEFKKIDPSYTSQTCNLCGFVDKKSRKNELFCCTKCGMKMDADINAAKNILMRGVYSPSSDEDYNKGVF